MEVTLVIISCVGSIASFIAGIFYERASWNGLIARGKLPAPGDRWIKL